MNPSVPSRPLNLGHRGASSLAPENTLAAFALARELGADGIEFDVQLSKDGELMVMHDDRLERTTNGHGFVGESAWSDLRDLDAGRWFDARFAGERIPRLQDVLDLFGASSVLNLEIKSTSNNRDVVERIVACVQQYPMSAQVIISSFNWELLMRVREVDPALRIGVLFQREVSAADYAVLQPEAIHPKAQLVSAALVADAHAHAQLVNTWTVNEADDMQRMIALQVDAIITNFPQRLKQLLDEEA